MSDLTELMELRPLVSSLRHDLEQVKRSNARMLQELTAERAMNVQLRAQIAAMRDSHGDEDTPQMGEAPGKRTTAITRRHQEHG